MVRALPRTLDQTQQRLYWIERGKIADALDLLRHLSATVSVQIGHVKLIGPQKVHDS